MRRIRRTLIATIITAAGAVLIAGHSGSAGARSAHAARAQSYSAKVTYHETNHGRPNGAATVAIQGGGSFSAKLGPHATLEAAVIALVSGVPVSKIAQGGTYRVQRDIAASGVITGLAVAKFKARGLGAVCLSYTEKPGRFVAGSSFVPMSGSLKTVGGTGSAAHWRASVSFKETSVTGAAIEQLGANGSGSVSVGKAKAMTKACRRVSALG